MPSQTATRHILLAEDNAADEALVREALREHNVACRLHVVKDGAQAISFILNMDREGVDEPHLDLLLLDMHLPRRDGADILRALRSTEHHSQKPVIVMSSSDAPHLRDTADHDALYFFHKPSTLDEFMLLGGIVRDVLNDRMRIAGGGA